MKYHVVYIGAKSSKYALAAWIVGLTWEIHIIYYGIWGCANGGLE